MSETTIMKEFSVQDVQQLLDNFWEMTSTADELNIYEWEEADEEMQAMKEWTNKTFGRKIEE